MKKKRATRTIVVTNKGWSQGKPLPWQQLEAQGGVINERTWPNAVKS